jgi:hypothetical protein
MMKPGMLTPLRQFLYQNKMKAYRSTNLDVMPEDHFSNIQTVGVLFEATEEAKETVKRFSRKLKAREKDVETLGYFNTKDEIYPQLFNFFTLSGVGFDMTPTSDVAVQFTQRPFDVLINLVFNDYPPINYIVAASKAHFKIGPATANPAHHDLMIDLGKDYTTAQLVAEIRKTFKLMT